MERKTVEFCVLDISAETVTLEFTAAGEMLDAFIQRLEQRFSIVEMARTGVTSLERGAGSFTDDI